MGKNAWGRMQRGAGDVDGDRQKENTGDHGAITGRRCRGKRVHQVPVGDGKAGGGGDPATPSPGFADA